MILITGWNWRFARTCRRQLFTGNFLLATFSLLRSPWRQGVSCSWGPLEGRSHRILITGQLSGFSFFFFFQGKELLLSEDFFLSRIARIPRILVVANVFLLHWEFFWFISICGWNWMESFVFSQLRLNGNYFKGFLDVMGFCSFYHFEWKRIDYCRQEGELRESQECPRWNASWLRTFLFFYRFLSLNLLETRSRVSGVGRTERHWCETPWGVGVVWPESDADAIKSPPPCPPSEGVTRSALASASLAKESLASRESALGFSVEWVIHLIATRFHGDWLDSVFLGFPRLELVLSLSRFVCFFCRFSLNSYLNLPDTCEFLLRFRWL